MTNPDITLDVDLRNPGQFFACCGVLELASRLWPGAEGWFAGEGSRAAFHVATSSGHNDPLGDIVRRLYEPDELVALADDHETQAQADRKPVVIVPYRLRLDWWLDSYGSGDKSELKVWAGKQTPHRNLTYLRETWRQIAKERSGGIAGSGLFLQRRPVIIDGKPKAGRFGLDPGASWESLDVGFSPDEQEMGVSTSPSIEILGVIGLQRCRPAAVENKRRWFSYRVWQTPLDIAVAPAVIVGAIQPRAGYEFPVVMRNAQYGSFGWAKPLEEER